MQKPMSNGNGVVWVVVTGLRTTVAGRFVSYRPPQNTNLPDATEIYIPPGSFWMGASEGDEHAGQEEKPSRFVTLSRGMQVLSCPVTQAMYEHIMGTNPCSFDVSVYPVEGVSWFDAIAFCNRLSLLEGQTPAYELSGYEEWSHQRDSHALPAVRWNRESEGWRLPTEAEWEYFCRAGSKTPLYDEREEIAWSYENAYNSARGVEFLKPNAWGLFDTLGNAFEWCFDRFEEHAYKVLPALDPVYDNPPKEPLTHDNRVNDKRVKRGGSWFHSTEYIRASARFWTQSHSQDDDLSFRIVRTVF